MAEELRTSLLPPACNHILDKIHLLSLPALQLPAKSLFLFPRAPCSSLSSRLLPKSFFRLFSLKGLLRVCTVTGHEREFFLPSLGYFPVITIQDSRYIEKKKKEIVFEGIAFRSYSLWSLSSINTYVYTIGWFSLGITINTPSVCIYKGK